MLNLYSNHHKFPCTQRRKGDTFITYSDGFSSGVASGDPLPGQGVGYSFPPRALFCGPQKHRRFNCMMTSGVVHVTK
jgi:hypothetical protein